MRQFITLMLLGCLVLGSASCGVPVPTPRPLVASPLPTVPPTITPTPAPSWGEITFSTSLVPSASSASPGLIFPGDTVRLYAFLPYRHLPAGARLEARWYLNELLVWSERVEPPAGSGTLTLESDYAPQGLAIGPYRLEVWRAGEMVQSDHFIILAPAPTATSTPIPSATPTRTATPTATLTSAPTATRTVTPTPTNTPDLATRLRWAYRSAVHLVTPKDQGGEARGSGVIIDARGFVLTNLHLVADPWSGQPYNRAGRVQVGVSDDPLTTAATMSYQADIALANVALDVAILRIRYDLAGQPMAILPTFPAARLGNDRELSALPDLHLCGFPGAVAGTVHGLYQRHSPDGLWVELAAPLLEGFSGAPVWNDRVELVGLLYSTEAAGMSQAASYYLRPINALKTLIEMAKQR